MMFWWTYLFHTFVHPFVFHWMDHGLHTFSRNWFLVDVKDNLRHCFGEMDKCYSWLAKAIELLHCVRYFFLSAYALFFHWMNCRCGQISVPLGPDTILSKVDYNCLQVFRYLSVFSFFLLQLGLHTLKALPNILIAFSEFTNTCVDYFILQPLVSPSGQANVGMLSLL